jgi:arsenite methyltransferase
MTEIRKEEKIRSAVRQAYGGIARRFVEEPAPAPAEGTVEAGCCGSAESAAQASCCGSSSSGAEGGVQASCCGPEVTSPAAARYYSEAELDGLPESVTDISLGCGNPLAISELQAGEVVLDLGSGGGIDCFLAAKQVGPEGKVIGLDMTPDMIKLARRNAKKVRATNVDFRYGEMEEIPLPDQSVDAVISNCVINLSPDKDAVFGEVFRVLRPGGRMNVSDIVVDGDLPQPIRDSLNAWAGCVAGALDESDYLSKIRAAGFEDVQVLSRDYSEIGEVSGWEDVQVLVAGPDGKVAEGEDAQALLSEAGLSPHDLAHKVASVKVRARKPE